MEKKGSDYGDIITKPPIVREPRIAYNGEKQQGEFVVEDYYALREKKRVELIDGVIYDMATPMFIHQMISGEIFMQLKAYINGKHGSCIPVYAPFGVQLDQDDRTMVETDIMISSTVVFRRHTGLQTRYR